VAGFLPAQTPVCAEFSFALVRHLKKTRAHRLHHYCQPTAAVLNLSVGFASRLSRTAGLTPFYGFSSTCVFSIFLLGFKLIPVDYVRGRSPSRRYAVPLSLSAYPCPTAAFSVCYVPRTTIRLFAALPYRADGLSAPRSPLDGISRMNSRLWWTPPHVPLRDRAPGSFCRVSLRTPSGAFSFCWFSIHSYISRPAFLFISMPSFCMGGRKKFALLLLTGILRFPAAQTTRASRRCGCALGAGAGGRRCLVVRARQVYRPVSTARLALLLGRAASLACSAGRACSSHWVK